MLVEVFELTVDYGAEELSALGRLLGAGEAPGLAAPDPAPMSAETRRAVHAAAWRGLVARRALLIEPGPPPSFAVAEPHASVLAPLIAPERASRSTAGRRGETHWTIYLREDAAVEQEALPGPALPPHAAPARERARAVAAGGGDRGPPARVRRPVRDSRGADRARTDDTHPLLYAALSVVTARGRARSGSTAASSASGAAAPGLAHARSGSNPCSADALRAALTALL